MTKSTLAEQRDADEALCDSLEAVACGFEKPNPWLLDRAATRITELSEDLKQACHDRDRYQADVERMGWQPIETAPKDGTAVLLYAAVPPRMAVPIVMPGFFDEMDDVWCSTLDTVDSPFVDPTHWQPLPPPPGEK